MHSFTLLLLSLVVLTLVGAWVGIRLTSVPALSRKALPFSGGMLGGIALFWILPEIATSFGWPAASAGLVTGFGLLWLIDRYLYPVCPSCSHTHEHQDCASELHGFAAPLLIASGLHSFFDGWSLAVSQHDAPESLKVAFLAGIAIHKLPEGLALGALLAAALGNAGKAQLGAAAAQSCMLAGGLLATLLSPYLGANWSIGFLAVAAGAFLYLGYHAVDAEYQLRGARTVVPALTGVAGAAALRTIVPGL